MFSSSKKFRFLFIFACCTKINNRIRVIIKLFSKIICCGELDRRGLATLKSPSFLFLFLRALLHEALVVRLMWSSFISGRFISNRLNAPIFWPSLAKSDCFGVI